MVVAADALGWSFMGNMEARCIFLYEHPRILAHVTLENVKAKMRETINLLVQCHCKFPWFF